MEESGVIDIGMYFTEEEAGRVDQLRQVLNQNGVLLVAQQEWKALKDLQVKAGDLFCQVVRLETMNKNLTEELNKEKATTKESAMATKKKLSSVIKQFAAISEYPVNSEDLLSFTYLNGLQSHINNLKNNFCPKSSGQSNPGTSRAPTLAASVEISLSEERESLNRPVELDSGTSGLDSATPPVPSAANTVSQGPQSSQALLVLEQAEVPPCDRGRLSTQVVVNQDLQVPSRQGSTTGQSDTPPARASNNEVSLVAPSSSGVINQEQPAGDEAPPSSQAGQVSAQTQVSKRPEEAPTSDVPHGVATGQPGTPSLPSSNNENIVEEHEAMEDSADDDIVLLENTNQIQNVIGNGRPQRNKRCPTRLSSTGPAHGAGGRKGNKFLCKCQREFRSKAGRSGHLQLHNDAWKRICPSCGDRFLDKKQLEEHFHSALNKCTFKSGSTSGGKMNLKKVQREIGQRKKQHGLCPREDGSTKWKCDCGQEFRSEKGFKNHEKRATTPNKFRCSFPSCNKTFNRVSDLRIHLKGTHKVLNPLSEYKKGCQKCGIMFKTDQEFNTHKRQPECTVQGQADLVPEAQPSGPLPTPSPTGVTGLVCYPPTAQNVTRPGSSANGGLASVTLLRPISASASTGLPSRHPYSCACGASFPAEQFLTGHILGNVKGAVFECNGCGDVFLNDQELTQHIAATAACNNVNVKTCGMCKSTFETLKDFNYHKQKCIHYPK